MTTARIVPMRIIVEEPGRQLMAEVVREVIKEQSGDGIAANGTRFPQGATKDPLTMYDTGRMQDVDVTVTPRQIKYTAPYADRVEAQYRWAGVSPQYMADVDRKLQTPAFLQYVKSI